jgi:hypothetical protein
MSIQTFIQQEVLLPRLKRHGVLVVYDPARYYQDLCLNLATEELKVVDATDSSIESREEAIRTLGELGQPDAILKGLLIYVPAPAPLTDEAKQRDPFALYGACGSLFPEGDGDEYRNLCLKAKPDHATEIRRLFTQAPQPSFAVIDAVGGGLGWPNLRTLLGMESARDIIFTLLAPGEAQLNALNGQESWVAEARELFAAALGLTLKTRARAWSTIADEVWRFLLFSEFAFDLPGPLPETLTNVPRAQDTAQPLVDDLCERLRSDRRTQPTYIERAAAIERDLNLSVVCQQLTDLGQRDTFPFEERTFLQRAMQTLEHGDLDQVRTILQRHTYSVWRGIGESQAQWGLVQAALQLVEACDDYERQLSDHARDQESLINFYVGGLRVADGLHREFEQAVGDALPVYEFMTVVIEQVRARYRRLAENVQVLFTKHLEASGWPPAGRLANTDVFDRLVAPKLQESGRRVAYVLVDALRYELGVALEQQLAEDGRVELHTAFAQLPSITPVGMASLLPGAGQQLCLRAQHDGLIPVLGDVPVTNVNQRMEIFRKRYGQRFAEMPLHDFVRSKRPVLDTVELLVLRSGEIDSQLENNPETTLGLIHETLKRIRFAIHKLKQQGFHEVVIATDHGFALNMQAEAGDVCVKPPGSWITVHERSLLGNGTADSHSFAVAAERVGIRGDFAQFAGPRTMAPYRAGLLYFHGGISLQEAVVPVLSVRLEATRHLDAKQAMVMLSYKNGATRITTRLPVIEVSLDHGNLFAAGAEFEILLEAHDRRGHVVGEAKAGGPVNPATGTMTLKPGERVQVPLKMQLEFEGKFKVKALNPTTMATYCSLDLQTDYTV